MLVVDDRKTRYAAGARTALWRSTAFSLERSNSFCQVLDIRLAIAEFDAARGSRGCTYSRLLCSGRSLGAGNCKTCHLEHLVREGRELV